MKILDIIAEDKSLTEGSLVNWFKRPFTDYLERRAAAKLVAEIEKKYAKDLAKQTACKDLSEKYGKYLAERELAGQTPIPLERLILKQKEYRGTSFASDAEFIDLTTRLAHVKKTQFLKDGAQAGKATPSPSSSPASGAVATTEEIIEKSKKSGIAISTWITMITGLTQFGFFVQGWYKDLYSEYIMDLKTNLANLNKGEFSPGDEQFFPPVTTQGTPVSSIRDAFVFVDGNKTFFVYDTDLKRMLAYKTWRDTTAQTLFWSKSFRYIASWSFTSVISGFTLGGKLLMFQKLSKIFSEFGSKWKWLRWPGYILDVTIAGLSTYAKDELAETMSGDKIDAAMRTLVLHKIDTWGPLVDQTGRNIDQALEGHKNAALFLGWVGLRIEELMGAGIEPRTAPSRPAVSTDVPAANPSKKDPSQPGKQVDQTDSNGTTTPAPVAKPEEKTKKQDAPNIPSEDNTAAGRGAKFTQAKDAGAATVVIGGKTYKTADFDDQGGYWTNRDTGESFVKN